MFDNSMNHHAKAPDALVASRLNMGNEGANVNAMRKGYFFDKNGNKVQQSMQLPDGTQKGLELILKERGLWPEKS